MGGAPEEFYWLPEPAALVATHLPTVPGWQLLAEPTPPADWVVGMVPRGAAFFKQGLRCAPACPPPRARAGCAGC